MNSKILEIAQRVINGEYDMVGAQEAEGLTDQEGRDLYRVLKAEGYFG